MGIVLSVEPERTAPQEPQERALVFGSTVLRCPLCACVEWSTGHPLWESLLLVCEGHLGPCGLSCSKHTHTSHDTAHRRAGRRSTPEGAFFVTGALRDFNEPLTHASPSALRPHASACPGGHSLLFLLFTL